MARARVPVTVIVVAALVASASLAGCIKSLRDPEDKELGALFVKRSCREATPRATATGGDAAVAAPLLALPAVPTLALQPTDPNRREIVVGAVLPADAPDLRRAAELAARQVQEALTPPGSPQLAFRLLVQDQGASAASARAAAQAVIALGADAIVGGTTYETANAILDAAGGRTPVLALATDPRLSTDRANGGFFFRLPASDALQGSALADLLWWDGCTSANVLTANDPVSLGIAREFRGAFIDKGGSVLQIVEFAPTATALRGEVQAATREDPAAVVVIGPASAGATAAKAAFEEGKMRKTVWFFSDGMRSPTFVSAVGKAHNRETNREEFVVSGLKGTAPEPREGPAADSFREAWMQAYPDDVDGPGLRAAETYDGVLVAALAGAAAARQAEVRGDTLRDRIPMVFNEESPSDVPVSGADVAQAIVLANAGTNVDYRGAAGDSDYDENGDPETATFLWWKVEDSGAISVMKTGVRPGEPPPFG